jgi:hypothetical protein
MCEITKYTPWASSGARAERVNETFGGHGLPHAIAQCGLSVTGVKLRNEKHATGLLQAAPDSSLFQVFVLVFAGVSSSRLQLLFTALMYLQLTAFACHACRAWCVRFLMAAHHNALLADGLRCNCHHIHICTLVNYCTTVWTRMA